MTCFLGTILPGWAGHLLRISTTVRPQPLAFRMKSAVLVTHFSGRPCSATVLAHLSAWSLPCQLTQSPWLMAAASGVLLAVCLNRA